MSKQGITQEEGGVLCRDAVPTLPNAGLPAELGGSLFPYHGLHPSCFRF